MTVMKNGVTITRECDSSSHGVFLPLCAYELLIRIDQFIDVKFFHLFTMCECVRSSRTSSSAFELPKYALAPILNAKELGSKGLFV